MIRSHVPLVGESLGAENYPNDRFLVFVMSKRFVPYAHTLSFSSALVKGSFRIKAKGMTLLRMCCISITFRNCTALGEQKARPPPPQVLKPHQTEIPEHEAITCGIVQDYEPLTLNSVQYQRLVRAFPSHLALA